MKKILALVSFSLTAATPLFASDNSGSPDPDADVGQAAKESAPFGRYQKVNARIFDNRFQASDLTSAPVQNADGKTIGSVIDLELSDQGRVAALYVELNDGVLCVFGNTIVRIDFDSFDIDPNTRKLTIKAHLGEEFQNFVTSID